MIAAAETAAALGKTGVRSPAMAATVPHPYALIILLYLIISSFFLQKQ